jgi:hypothetical protein
MLSKEYWHLAAIGAAPLPFADVSIAISASAGCVS